MDDAILRYQRMALSKKTHFVFAVLLISATSNVYALEPITVKLRFHIVTELAMHKRDLLMDSWVTPVDIRHKLLEEINTIWRPAGINFIVEDVIYSPALRPQNRQKLVQNIVNAQRDAQGKADAKRIKSLNRLIDWQNHRQDTINIYLVPYLGEKSNGNASVKNNRIFVGQWSDKHSKARISPEKRQLVEPRPMHKGSIARTIAHEIGHIFRLKHPNKEYQREFNLLMGGRKSGYVLTQQQIAIARDAAKNFVRKR